MNQLLQTLNQFHGIASTALLAERGISPQDIERAVRRGDLVRLRQRWVAAPDAPAQLVRAVRAGGRLSCVSVLARHRVWCRDDGTLHLRVDRGFRHLSSPHDRRVPLTDPSRYGLTVHRTIPSSLRDVEFAVDPVHHALLQAIRCQPRADAIASIDSALNKRFVTLDEVDMLLEALPVRCRRYRTGIDPESQSGLETKARLSLRGSNVPFRSQVWIDRVGSVDLLIGDRLVLELDGYEFHSKKNDFENDRRRDVELARQQYRVLRASYDQVMNDWDAVFAVVRQLIAAGEHRCSAVHRRRQR